MARPIAPTPILEGKEAQNFLVKMNNAVMTPERLKWLKSVAEESKQAEKRNK